MSDSAESLRRKIETAKDLNAVARTMKALAAASIGQYETAVKALNAYHRTVQLGIAAILHRGTVPILPPAKGEKQHRTIIAVVFGSDQGLVGQFNDVLVKHVVETLAGTAGEPMIWAVGERIHGRLTDEGLAPKGLFDVPHSVDSITPLIGRILIETEAHRSDDSVRFLLFHNAPRTGSIYQPEMQGLLPLDEAWRQALAGIKWPSNNLPQIVGTEESLLRRLIGEYIFVSLFRACAESLASENASRLAAMQRAEKNIEELLEDLNGTSQRLRQSSIDEELFDVISGYEMLEKTDKQSGPRNSVRNNH